MARLNLDGMVFDGIFQAAEDVAYGRLPSLGAEVLVREPADIGAAAGLLWQAVQVSRSRHVASIARTGFRLAPASSCGRARPG